MAEQDVLIQREITTSSAVYVMSPVASAMYDLPCTHMHVLSYDDEDRKCLEEALFGLASVVILVLLPTKQHVQGIIAKLRPADRCFVFQAHRHTRTPEIEFVRAAGELGLRNLAHCPSSRILGSCSILHGRSEQLVWVHHITKECQ